LEVSELLAGANEGQSDAGYAAVGYPRSGHVADDGG
jgi:hypothetical protein